MSESTELQRRPETCPECDGLLEDEFTWIGGSELVSQVLCNTNGCEWYGHIELTVKE